MALLSWDQETYMTQAGGLARASQMETLSGIYHEKSTRTELDRAITKAEEEISKRPESYSFYDKALVREMRRDFTIASKLPKSLVQEMSKHMSLGLEAWKAARIASDFSLFAPSLSIMIDLKRQAAEYIGYKDSPYDALLDEYEAGLTKKKVASTFSKLKPQIVTLLPKLTAKTASFDTNIFSQAFEEKKLWDVTLDLLRTIGFDMDKGRQDVSTHPFTMGLHPTDVRLTTRVIETNPLSTIMSSIHEAGHGMYEQNIAPEIANTVLGRADSLVIHESQSRFFENMIGKSKSFWKYFFPTLQQAFPKQLDKVSWEQAWQEVNVIKPSLIRVDADEVSYHMHIISRFEVESALIEGTLKVADAQEAWNAKYKEYLGIDVPNDARGILQDIHWSQGLIGYFPTYSFGSLFSAQLFYRIKQDHPDLEMLIEQGQFATIRKWLSDKIHIYGKTYSSAQVAVNVTGEDLDQRYFVDYIHTKFGLE